MNGTVFSHADNDDSSVLGWGCESNKFENKRQEDEGNHDFKTEQHKKLLTSWHDTRQTLFENAINEIDSQKNQGVQKPSQNI